MQWERPAVTYVRGDDRRGGALAALESGFVQRRIHESALRWQGSVESGERQIVGVNCFQTQEAPPSIFRPDPQAREQVLEDLARVRDRRDPEPASLPALLLDCSASTCRRASSQCSSALPSGRPDFSHSW